MSGEWCSNQALDSDGFFCWFLGASTCRCHAGWTLLPFFPLEPSGNRRFGRSGECPRQNIHQSWSRTNLGLWKNVTPRFGKNVVCEGNARCVFLSAWPLGFLLLGWAFKWGAVHSVSIVEWFLFNPTSTSRQNEFRLHKRKWGQTLLRCRWCRFLLFFAGKVGRAG